MWEKPSLRFRPMCVFTTRQAATTLSPFKAGVFGEVSTHAVGGSCAGAEPKAASIAF